MHITARCHPAVAAAEEIDRLVLEIACPVRPHQHARAAAIGHQAAIGRGQRVADHPRAEHVRDRERTMRERRRVEVGPGAGRHRDLGQLLARRAELVHVPARRQRIRRDRMPRLVGGLVHLLLAHRDQPPAGAALVRAVADQRRVALPGRQRHRGAQQMRLEARPADIGAVLHPRLDAQILRHRQGRERVRAGRRIQPVDVAEREPRIGDRRQRRFRHQLGRGPIRCHSGAGAADADDRRRPPQTHFALSGSNTTNGAPSSSTIRAVTRVPIGTVSTPSTRDIIRGPSSRSISAML